ncbi:CGNR zinc finger domain-containing protein [Microbacterium sp. LWH10-1.2]|uniref:CGNR zinc finger domain-containing protein n=1 Tax=Microbacterium sp. LWH10-1.2 TaxID=3135255 RepID=UPI00313964AF
MNIARSAVPEELRAVEDLCNSAMLLRGIDALATIRGGREWLVRYGWEGEVTPEHLASLRGAREDIRSFLTDRTDPSARSTLNRLAREHWESPCVDDSGRLALTPSGARAVSPAGAAVGALLLHGLTGSGLRLRTCASEACRWVFYDSSRSGTRTWCDMNTCGARSKMRHYRDRLA